MLDYALKAVQFTQGRRRPHFDTDEMLAMAVIHSVESIGEAARTVSLELRDRYPEVPWDSIIGTRNRLTHGYIDVDLDVIWAIVSQDLPPLIAQLEHILKEEGSHAGP